MPGLPKKFIKSITYAWNGIGFLFKTQLNARIELIIAFFVLFAGFIFKISSFEWIAILLCIAVVLALEGINTAFEGISNKLHPDFDQQIGNAKDVAAGAVLIACCVAVVIGFIIFAPHLWDFISQNIQ